MLTIGIILGIVSLVTTGISMSIIN